MAQSSQMTGLTIGRFSELFVKMPPDNQYENVAEVLTGLASDNDSHTNTEQDLQTQINQKQNLLSVRFPLRLEDDVLL